MFLSASDADTDNSKPEYKSLSQLQRLWHDPTLMGMQRGSVTATWLSAGEPKTITNGVFLGTEKIDQSCLLVSLDDRLSFTGVSRENTRPIKNEGMLETFKSFLSCLTRRENHATDGSDGGDGLQTVTRTFTIGNDWWAAAKISARENASANDKITVGEHPTIMDGEDMMTHFDGTVKQKIEDITYGVLNASRGDATQTCLDRVEITEPFKMDDGDLSQCELSQCAFQVMRSSACGPDASRIYHAD